MNLFKFLSYLRKCAGEEFPSSYAGRDGKFNSVQNSIKKSPMFFFREVTTSSTAPYYLECHF